jgi:hypothetical protein
MELNDAWVLPRELAGSILMYGLGGASPAISKAAPKRRIPKKKRWDCSRRFWACFDLGIDYQKGIYMSSIKQGFGRI